MLNYYGKITTAEGSLTDTYFLASYTQGFVSYTRHCSMRDLVISQRFSPEFGGSITWLREVYRRWPNPIDIFTHDYEELNSSEVKKTDSQLVKEKTSRVQNVYREDILMNDWGVTSPSSLARYYRMNRAASRGLKKFGRLCAHCTHAVPEVSALIPLKHSAKKNLKIICYAHGEEILACNTSRQLRPLMKKSYEISDLVIANSENTKRLVEETGARTTITVINPGVSLANFASSKRLGLKWRRDNGFKENDFLLLTLGRLCQRKNQAGVIEAIALLKDQLPNLKYLIAGEGETKAELKKLATSLSVENRVKFITSPSDDLKVALYGSSDLFVMPAVEVDNDLEGFGISFIEAAACGKASISGLIGGQTEAVKHNQTGVNVDGESPSDIAEAILTYCSNPEGKLKLEQNALEWAKSLDWDRVTERTVCAINAI